MEKVFEAEKLPRPHIATRVAVYTIDQGTANPVGVYPGGLAFLAKDAQCPEQTLLRATTDQPRNKSICMEIRFQISLITL